MCNSGIAFLITITGTCGNEGNEIYNLKLFFSQGFSSTGMEKKRF